MSDVTDQNYYPRAKHQATISIPVDWPGDPDMLDVWRAGSKRNGYHYGIATFSGEGTFRFLWLSDEQREELIRALGGTP